MQQKHVIYFFQMIEMGGDKITDKEKVLELLETIAFTSPACFSSIVDDEGKQKIVWKDIGALPENVKKAIAVVKNTSSGIVVETLDRMKAIDLLMKYMGMDNGAEGGVLFEGEGELEE